MNKLLLIAGIILCLWYLYNMNVIEPYYPYYRRRLPYWRRNVLDGDWSWFPMADRYTYFPQYYTYNDY